MYYPTFRSKPIEQFRSSPGLAMYLDKIKNHFDTLDIHKSDAELLERWGKSIGISPQNYMEAQTFPNDIRFCIHLAHQS